MPIQLNSRAAHHDIAPFFLERWSPRAFLDEAISEDALMSLFEAARWAPSAGNGQPWRFVYARRGAPAWDGALDALVDSNQIWAKHAAVLIFAISDLKRARPNGELVDNPTSAFDTGAAWGYLALQAHHLGLAAHGMGGFDRNKAAIACGVDQSRFQVLLAIAAGRPGGPDLLPEDLRARETPSGRKPVSDFVFEGKLGG
ncbi:nitroreductase family protein [Phenylobacterium immobile]|uniref:nitroreductase family protein n=1 Tax=Phenylobacterium immobile TaxID=21 RepID=UPI000AA61EBB|nr:nitroreductase family protein [Phenylobacterium immobile]